MGKAFLAKSNGGGGGGLAFRVLGGTSAPSSPKPNDIWVNTDEEITSYIFSATEPEGYAPGMLCIFTGASSSVAFTVTNKNPIVVYPLSAKQFIDGAWVEKTAKSYQNGEWVNWFNGTYLYKDGNEYTEITGGFSAISGTLTKESATLAFETDGTNFNAFSTVNKVARNGARKLYVTVSQNPKVVRFGVSNTRTATRTSWLGITDLENGKTGTFDLNIENAPDTFYICIGCGNGTGKYTIKVSEIYLE